MYSNVGKLNVEYIESLKLLGILNVILWYYWYNEIFIEKNFQEISQSIFKNSNSLMANNGSYYCYSLINNC